MVQTPHEHTNVQADEIRVRCQRRQIVWLAMAVCATTRLWLGAVVSPHRATHGQAGASAPALLAALRGGTDGEMAGSGADAGHSGLSPGGQSGADSPVAAVPAGAGHGVYRAAQCHVSATVGGLVSAQPVFAAFGRQRPDEHVLGGDGIQLLYAAPELDHAASGTAHAGDGRWGERAYLECVGVARLSGRAAAVCGSEKARASTGQNSTLSNKRGRHTRHRLVWCYHSFLYSCILLLFLFAMYSVVITPQLLFFLPSFFCVFRVFCGYFSAVTIPASFCLLVRADRAI